jgi:hypothetical protein
VGKRLVKARRKGLRARIREPQELVDFILEHPIRVAAGPKDQFYIVDHHHLAMALMEEGFKTAPVVVLDDLSKLTMAAFWKEMAAKGWVHPYDGKGKKQPLSAIPTSIEDMHDDPYRSLAGFVRREGGFLKSQTPFAEFTWANYYRSLIPLKLVKKDFDKALRQAVKLSNDPEAASLPGFVKKPVRKDKDDE